MAFGVVAGTDQRTTFHIFQPHLQSNFFVVIEQIRVDELRDRLMRLCRLQILTNGDHITAVHQEVFHDFIDFLGRLPEVGDAEMVNEFELAVGVDACEERELGVPRARPRCPCPYFSTHPGSRRSGQRV